MTAYTPNAIAEQCGELIKWSIAILLGFGAADFYSPTRQPGRKHREELGAAVSALTDALLCWQRSESRGVVSTSDLLTAARKLHALKDAEILRESFILEKAKWLAEVGEAMPRSSWNGSRRLLKYNMDEHEEQRHGFAWDRSASQYGPAMIAHLESLETELRGRS
jgi:hypothetical protein